MHGNNNRGQIITVIQLLSIGLFQVSSLRQNYIKMYQTQIKIQVKHRELYGDLLMVVTCARKSWVNGDPIMHYWFLYVLTYCSLCFKICPVNLFTDWLSARKCTFIRSISTLVLYESRLYLFNPIVNLNQAVNVNWVSSDLMLSISI